jgi:hypothetical protein
MTSGEYGFRVRRDDARTDRSRKGISDVCVTGSPTQKVGGEAQERFGKITQGCNAKLANAFSEGEIYDFVERVRETLEPPGVPEDRILSSKRDRRTFRASNMKRHSGPRLDQGRRL